MKVKFLLHNKASNAKNVTTAAPSMPSPKLGKKESIGASTMQASSGYGNQPTTLNGKSKGMATLPPNSANATSPTTVACPHCKRNFDHNAAQRRIDFLYFLSSFLLDSCRY